MSISDIRGFRRNVVAGLSIFLLSACSHAPRIVVGSKNFTEQVLLGEILGQQIERRMRVPVERKLDLGGTLLAHEALVKGSIDLYPEYAGTAVAAILKQPAPKSPAASLAFVRAEYRKRWRLEWLAPLGFDDTFAMIVRRDAGITTLSQAAAAHPWKLGVGYEFEQRPDGLKGLLATYGLRTEGPPLTMDLGLLYSALTSGKVDMIAANSTDGLAAALPVTILKDDKDYFPSYECAVVVRQDTLKRFPKLRGVLEELSGKLPDAAMRKLNYKVDGQHIGVHRIAGDFLRQILPVPNYSQ